ncbi:MAG: aminoacyl-tRNA hydrolase [Candidatus Altiarchaeales archaeon HGW-Altiarchaeales-3]|nr:MAG: aminoacyl-tRNA hydrolase [Candidatus Altiarchaeales archaeon HGW-Altiarchaeales-3]
MELKQIMIIRKDLKLSRGKLAVQVAHASVTSADKSKFKSEWLNHIQKKAVLKCEDLNELLSLFEKAKREGLPCALIRDAGRTEIPAGTVTCVGIGPAPEKDIDKITGDLKLL